MTCPLRSTSITPASTLLQGSPPLSGASVLSASRLEPLAPCMGLCLSRSFGTPAHLLSFVSFFVRSESPFLRPDPRFAYVGARRSCQGWPSHRLAACSAFTRPHLDSFEHGGTLGAVGMTIRGEPAFGHDQSRHNLVSGGCKSPTMMQQCASAAKFRSGGPILFLGITAMAQTGTRHPATVTSGRTGPKLLGAFSNLRLLRRAQNDAVRHHALSHEPPQGDQKLAGATRCDDS